MNGIGNGGKGSIGDFTKFTSERDRRLLRLKQVREQSKEIAKKMRCKFSEEKSKQSTLASANKKIEFENLKKSSLTALQNKFDSLSTTIGASHSAMSVEESQRKEWISQKEYNANKALKRGKAASDTVLIKTRQVNERLKQQRKRLEASRSGKSATHLMSNVNESRKSSGEKINHFYIETDDFDNCCSNFANNLENNSNIQFPLLAPVNLGDSNPTSNRKRVTISDGQDFSSFPNVIENSVEVSKKHSVIIDTQKETGNESKIQSQDQLSITDIQKALCDCQPHFSSIATKVEHLFNNNNKDMLEHIKNPSEPMQKVTSKVITNGNQSKGVHPCSCKVSENNVSSNYTPLNIVSDYLKNREVCFENNTVDNSKKYPAECDVSHLAKAKDVIEHSRYLHCSEIGQNCSSVLSNNATSKLFGQKKYSDLLSSSEDWITRSAKKGKESEVLKRNFNRKTCNLSVKKSPIRNIKLGKKIPPNASLKVKSSIRSWEIAPPQHYSERSINSYDQANKFSKKIFINDKYLVERLPKDKYDAYENARKEVEDNEAIAAAIQAAKKNDISKYRGTAAMEKVRASDDYRNLIEELEVLTKEERLIGKAFPSKSFKDNVRAQDEEIKHQQHMNMSVKHMFNRLHSNDNVNPKIYRESSDCEGLQMKSQFPRNPNTIDNNRNDSAVNVAAYNVYKNFKSKHKSDMSLNDSESSVQSIVFKKPKSIVNQRQEEEITNIESKEKSNVRDEEKIASNFSKKLVSDCSNSTEEKTRNVIHKKFSKKVKIPSSNKENDHMSSTSSTVSFNGLQIVIEVNKGKREASKVKTIQTKNEEVQTITEKFDSSSEVSIKTSKVFAKREVIFERVKSPQHHDSSESTTYMSPPEKITTHFDKMVNKGYPVFKDAQMNTSNVSIHHAGTLIMKNKAVNTDLNFNDNARIVSRNSKYSGGENSFHEIKDLHRTSESLTSVSQDIRLDFINQSKNTSSNVEIDPRLKNYVMKLLRMSEKEVNKLNIDVSDIYTPSSSVINTSLNKPLPSTGLIDKVHRLKKFIKENYVLLDEFKKEESILNVGKVKYNVKKPTSSSIDLAIQSKSVNQKLDGSPSLFKNDNNTTKTQSHLKNTKNKYSSTKETLATSSQEYIDNHSSSSNENISEIKKNKSCKIIPVECEIKNKVGPNLNIKTVRSHSPSSFENEDMFIILHADKSEVGSENNEPDIDPATDVNDTCKENEELNQLSDKYTKRILNLSEKLDQVRREKHAILSSNASSSSEDSTNPPNNKTTLTDIGFVPMLDDIPKPNNDENRLSQISSLRKELHSNSQSMDTFLPKLPEFAFLSSFNSNDFQKAKPPMVINNQSMMRNKEILTVTPHELSTIIEVDTPATAKNTSIRLKHVDTSPVSTKHGNLIDFDHDIRLDREKSVDKQVEVPNLPIPSLEDSIQVDANLKPFISLKDYIHHPRNETKFEEFPSVQDDSSLVSNDTLRAVAVDLLKRNLMSEKLKSGYSSSNTSSDNSNSSIAEALALNKSLLLMREEMAFKDILHSNYDVSGVHTLQTTSNSSAELEKLIKSIGPDWGLAMLKKTQEAQTLSSSNSSSQIRLDTLVNEKLGKTVDAINTTIGLSTLNDDLSFSDELFQRKNATRDILTSSLYRELDYLLKEFSKKVHQRNEREPRVSFFPSESNKENTATAASVVDSANIHSKDKTQHRTSTPVQLFKSSTSSNTQNSSNNGSGSLFNVDSDLSSVKNISNCDKTLIGDRLSVPNVSLKFGKLFDSSASLQSDE